MAKLRAKMSIETRAKQFLPFAAVGGLDEALERKLKEFRERQKNNSMEDPDFNTDEERVPEE